MNFKYQIIRMQTIITIFVCIVLAQSYNPCSVIKFTDYSFDLSSLKTFTIASQDSQFYTKIFPCSPTACDSNTSSQKSFMQKGGNAMCQPYTINATTIQNFNYIDSQSPKIGIKINYYPLMTVNQSGNETINTYYEAQFNLYCSTTTNVADSCTETVSAPSSALVDGVTVKTKKSTMICSASVSNGCPYLTVNNFWQFLSNNSIWFAIILWIFSIFELFMGYFVIRLTILLYGIMTGAVFGVIFSAQNYTNFFNDDTGNGIIIFIILLSALMGILFGLALLTLPRLGYVNIGMWDAIIFSLLLQNSVLYLSGSMTGFYITLGVTCLIMLAISLLRFRKFIILSTPFISAFWIVRTLGFVLPYYPNEFASEKLFAINSSTPWQFYLYLVSIIILSVLGCTFQFCWYKKKGRDHGNKGYYLQDDDNIKDKLKKFLQFKEVKDFINAGKEEMMFLKKLVVDRESGQQEDQHQQKKPKSTEIQMTKITKSKEKGKAEASNNKKSHITESQVDYNRKLKKVDSSQEEQELKQAKPSKVNSTNKKSNNNSKVKNPPQEKYIKSSGQQSSSSEQEQTRNAKIKIKKRKN